VDLNGDGYLDIISGSWPGELFFFEGGPDRTFAAPVKLKNKFGKTINIGGGRRDSNKMILVAGDAVFDEQSNYRAIIYEGERIEIPEGENGGITGTASVVHAVDWDGDGDLDLLVGDIGGNVYLIPNEGTAQAYSFGTEQQLKAGGKPLRVNGDAGPFVADWDGDGKLDLLVGAGDGSVSLFRNIGSPGDPELAAAEKLVAPGTTAFGADAPAEPRRGIRAKVCVTDWDGDGRLDLLVGDFATQKPQLPPATPEQQAEQDRIRKELEGIQNQWSELINKLYSDKKVDNEERDKLQKQLTELSPRMEELRSKLPPEYENHGWIWLFLRNPIEPKATER
jgi:hypothetical protein